MKNYVFVLGFTMMSIVSFGQNIPYPVKNAFKQKFPDVKKVNWDKEKSNYEASFEVNKIDNSILFDSNGNIIETEVEIQVNQLPKGVATHINSNYKGQKIKEAAKIIDAKGNETYEAEINGKDLVFDNKGTFIKEIKEYKSKTTTRKVPDGIAEEFHKKHPTATIIKWNDEPPIWEVKYSEGTTKGAISYNSKKQIVETELVIEKTKLPNSSLISDYFKSNYPKEKIQRCEKITRQDGTNTYEIQITGKEIVFDAKGKFLSEELD